MQLRITENLQQKIFIRSSFEFGFRLPKIKTEELHNEYPPELANRFLIRSPSKRRNKTADRFFVGFVANHLRDYFAFAFALPPLLHHLRRFAVAVALRNLQILVPIRAVHQHERIQIQIQSGGLAGKSRGTVSVLKRDDFDFALTKNDRLVADYLLHRESHFNIIKRQFSQLIVFKVMITAGLLLIGGYLVLNQQMNIGQFVARENHHLAGHQFYREDRGGPETLYDVLTATEKLAKLPIWPLRTTMWQRPILLHQHPAYGRKPPLQIPRQPRPCARKSTSRSTSPKNIPRQRQQF
jgi:hypothetical protein